MKLYIVLDPRLVRFPASYLTSVIGKCWGKCQPSFGFGKWNGTPFPLKVSGIFVLVFTITQAAWEATLPARTFPLQPFLAWHQTISYKSLLIFRISITGWIQGDTFVRWFDTCVMKLRDGVSDFIIAVFRCVCLASQLSHFSSYI